MTDRMKVVLLGRGQDLASGLRNALGEIGFERIPNVPFEVVAREVAALRPTIVVMDEEVRADEGTVDALRAVAPQAWFIDAAGVVRRRPEGGHDMWPVTKAFRLEPL